jgi:hypothetical protein
VGEKDSLGASRRRLASPAERGRPRTPSSAWTPSTPGRTLAGVPWGSSLVPQLRLSSNPFFLLAHKSKNPPEVGLVLWMGWGAHPAINTEREGFTRRFAPSARFARRTWSSVDSVQRAGLRPLPFEPSSVCRGLELGPAVTAEFESLLLPGAQKQISRRRWFHPAEVIFAEREKGFEPSTSTLAIRRDRCWLWRATAKRLLLVARARRCWWLLGQNV